MVRADVQIINELGMHARASVKLAQLVSRFESDVWITSGSHRINANSIMGIMMLAAGKGSTVMVETSGRDEREALAAIVSLIADQFGEGE